MKNAHASGRGFRLSHVGCQPLIFFTETEANAEKWTAALLDAVSFK
jgi:hypothetical protein